MVKLIYLPYFENQSFTHSNSKSWDLFSDPEGLNNYSVGHSEVKMRTVFKSKSIILQNFFIR